jgi:hypothetical protein
MQAERNVNPGHVCALDTTARPTDDVVDSGREGKEINLKFIACTYVRTHCMQKKWCQSD